MKCLHGGSELEAARVFRACIYSCFVRALNSDRLWALARKANSLLLLVLPVGCATSWVAKPRVRPTAEVGGVILLL